MEITDVGEFVDGVYHTHEASSLYSILIGRNLPFTNTKSHFREDDIVKKGYIWKQGSWRKSWKRRYFILRSDIRELCYYPSQDHLTLIGSICIDQNTIVWDVAGGAEGPELENAFMVRWQDGPAGSTTQKQRQVMLKAESPAEMTAWLTAITNECTRTQERPVVDWWSELFGKIGAVDNKIIRATIRETIRRISSGRGSMLQPQMTSLLMRPSSMRLTLPRLSSGPVDGIENGVCEDVQGDMMSVQPGRETCMDRPEGEILSEDGLLEQEDCRAEQQAESAIRVVEHWKEFTKRSSAAGAEAAILDEHDSDSEMDAKKCESAPAKPSFTTVVQQAIMRQGSGSSAEDEASGRMRALSKAAIAENQLLEEPDMEEEFVFTRTEEDEDGNTLPPDEDIAIGKASFASAETASTAPNNSDNHTTAAAAAVAMSVVSLNEPTPSSPATVRSARKREARVSAAEERYEHNLAGGGSTKKKKEKVEKQKPIGPPPFQHPTAERFEINDSLTGISICVELNNLMEGGEKIFCVLFAGNMASHLRDTSVSIGRRGEGRATERLVPDWRQVCRTETYKLESNQEHARSHMKRVVRQFHIVQEPVMMEECSHIMIALYKSGGRRELKANEQDLTAETAVCRCIVRKDFLLMSIGGPLKLDMKILSFSRGEQAPISVEDEQATASLGLLLISSPELCRRRTIITSNFKSQPYCDVLYCFHARQGQVVALEQLYASRYSVTVATAFLELLIQERSAIMEKSRKMVKKDLAAAISALKQIPSKTALQELDDMLTGGGGFEWKGGGGNGSNTIDTVSRAESLQKTKTVLKDIEEQMIENYKDCYEHCGRILNGYPLQGSVLAPEIGGSVLRRSVWKKSSVWQFCATNLNINVLTYHKISNSDWIQSQTRGRTHSMSDGPEKTTSSSASANQQPQHDGSFDSASGTDTVFHVTFGCPAAHYMGFHDGGLRRIMQGLGQSEKRRLHWMSVLQATGGISVDAFIDYVRSSLAQAEKLFDCAIDTYSPDGITTLFQKASRLAMRLDTCCSQMLTFAATMVKTVCFMAAQGVTHQKRVLQISLAQGNFLLAVQSLLSTQGHEMGMIEDLEAAVLWLSSVTIRLVRTNRDFVRQDTKKEPEGESKSRQRPRKRSRRVTSRYTLDDKGEEVMSGVCEDICITRDQTTGNIIMDLEMSMIETSAIQSALATIEASRQHGEEATPQSPGTATVEGVIVDGGSPLTRERTQATPEGSAPEVLAEFALTGVLFTQGVNEMQTLANMSGGESVRQVEINNASYSRLRAYVEKCRQILTMQVDAKTRNLVKTRPKSGFNVMYNPSPSVTVKNNQDQIDDSQLMITKIDKLMAQLEKCLSQSTRNPAEKNVGILLHSTSLCRLVGGSVGILCKSGKDRTSMGVTLEQSRILADVAGLEDGNEACRIMRKCGVRRMNVYANTGQSCYAFNNFQQQLLPKCFRPPGGTYTGNVAT